MKEMKTKEEILNEFGCPPIPFDENVTMYYPAILSAMDEYASQFRQEWIPVEERLPDIIEDLWTTININGNTFVQKNWYIKPIQKWDLYGEYVTAWQPIIKPQPYNPTKS